ncbi:MAG: TonB C-terminal domain-containing protein, partial [Proteobacteria bacterium]|nr:TonB C-terminal domain-containing protein [Pseudomonadota bacterium]
HPGPSAPPPLPVPSPQATTAIPPQKTTPPSKSTTSADHSRDLFSAFSRESKTTNTPLQGQADGDPMGDSAIQEGERYFGLLSVAVRRHYDVSSTIPENQRNTLKATALIRISPNGKLLEAKLTQSSGNPLFNTAVESALRKAAPFSPPPEHLKESLRKNGVQLVFTP